MRKGKTKLVLYNTKTGGRFEVTKKNYFAYKNITKKENLEKRNKRMLNKEETFIPIKKYEENYEIGTHGNVKNIKTGRVLRKRIAKNGYERVTLSKNGKLETKNIQNIMGDNYFSGYKHLKQMNHLDENKQNNLISNLSKTTAKENCNYGTRNQRIKETKEKNKKIKDYIKKKQSNIR